MIDRPEGIIKTMPAVWVNERGGSIKEIEKFWTRERPDDYYCMFNLSGQPKYDVLYFYLLFSGAVRLRANIIGYEGGKDLLCWDGKYHHGKCWVQIAAPFTMADEPVEMKGFQGFRYTEKLF
jgi:hypothetical protein